VYPPFPETFVTTPHASESPLDPFLARFLHEVGASSDGFQPGAESKLMAQRLDVPLAFIDALFTSARTRGLLKPAYGRGSKIRWQLSPAGADLARTFQDGSGRDSG
jgi:hypothetical protein